jgi:hypothetical protein
MVKGKRLMLWKDTPASDPMTAPAPVRLSEGGEMRWDHESRAACLAALVNACSEPERDKPGIDGETTAERVVDAVVSAVREDVPQACFILAEWLHESALDAVREYGRENDVSVWEHFGRPLVLDLGVYVP